MFRLFAFRLRVLRSSADWLKVLLIPATICVLCCGSAWSQEQPANLQLASEAPSIRIVFDGQAPAVGWYRASLRNESSHVVTDICVGYAPESSNAVNSFKIPAGGTFPLMVTAQNAVLLQAVLYDDGSYEGEPKQAAMMAAMRVGKLLLWNQVKPRIDEIVARDASDESKLELIQAEVSSLPENPEPSAVDMLKAAYPKVPLVEPVALGWLTSGFTGMKAAWTNAVSAYGNLFAQNPRAHEPLAEWWSRIEKEYDPSAPAVE
jgi:hypothetical protein